MALDTTSGGEAANSYVSVADADEYIGSLPYDTVNEWAALSTEEKEYRLKLAALFMNTFAYRGAPACLEQNLAFPRWWRTDDGYPDDEDTYEAMSDITDAGYTAPVISDEIKNAQCEIAFQVVHTIVLGSDVGDFAESPVRMLSLGGNMSIEFDNSAQGSSVLSKAKLSSSSVISILLGKWIKQVGGLVV